MQRQVAAMVAQAAPEIVATLVPTVLAALEFAVLMPWHCFRRTRRRRGRPHAAAVAALEAQADLCDGRDARAPGARVPEARGPNGRGTAPGACADVEVALMQRQVAAMEAQERRYEAVARALMHARVTQMRVITW